MPKPDLTKLMPLTKEFSENKSPILPSLPIPIKLPETKPLNTENTSKKKSKSLKNIWYGSTTEETKSTEKEKNSKNKDVMPL